MRAAAGHFRRTCLGLPTAVAFALAVPGAALGAAGDLDPSFGTGGKFIQAFGPRHSNVNAAAVQADGKIVLAGFSQQSATAPNNSDFELIRLNADGTLDLGFGGGDGEVTTPISAGTADDVAFAVAVDPASGAIYVAGSTDPPPALGSDFGDIVLARYTSAGVIDSSFGGGDGIVIQPVSVGSFDAAYAVAVQPGDGKPVIAGQGGSGSDWLAARYDTAGNLDPSFNAAGAIPGIATTSFGSGIDRAAGLQLLSGGKLLTAGSAAWNSSAGDLAAVQFNSNGTLDTAGFGAGTGKIATASPADQTGSALALTGDGRFLIAGNNFDFTGSPIFKDFLVARYNADGSPDTTFSGDGTQTTSFIAQDGTRFAKATGVAVQADGKTLVSGDAFINCGGLGCADFALARYDSSGELDPEFGSGGKKTLGIGADNDFATALVLQTTPGNAPTRRDPGDERAVIAGESGDAGDTDDRDAAAAAALDDFVSSLECDGGVILDKYAVRVRIFPSGSAIIGPGSHEISIHADEKAVKFHVSVGVPPRPQRCNVRVVESDESLAQFDLGGQSPVIYSGQMGGPGSITSEEIEFIAYPKKVGVLVNEVRAYSNDRFLGSATARINVYDDQTSLDQLQADLLEGAARVHALVGGQHRVETLDGQATAKVEVAVLQKPKGLQPFAKPRCEWLTKGGRFKGVAPSDGGACDEPIWIKAKLGKTKNGRTPFSYAYKHELPPGKYVAYSRSTNEAGVAEPEFSTKIGNEQTFKVKR
jgi:uncharacterized delta-60 repeat protein